ncbi:MAG: M20 family metallopeptidase [Propionicimonas sp.]
MTWPTPAAATLLHDLSEELHAVLPEALGLRRDLHRHPDLGGFEDPTAERLRQALPGLPTTPAAGTGFLARVGPLGPAIGLRAELDALPVAERTDVPWASTNGTMHACGHDVHMAATWALLQAARRLPSLPVGLLGVFQPREEMQPSGAAEIAESGQLEQHDLRAMIGVHVQPRLPLGVVSASSGGVNAAADEFDIVIHGEPGHGAYPHIAIDPIPILATIVLGLQELIGRTIDPIRPALISVGEIRAGASHNVIPASGSLHGIIRTMHDEDQVHLHDAIRRLANHTARARGARAEVRIVTGDPVLANDARLAHLTEPLLNGYGMLPAYEPFRSLGADDFSHYSRLAPSLMIFVGTGHGPTNGGRHEIGLHHPEFLPDDEAVAQAAAAYAAGYVAGAHLVGAI